MKKRLIQIRSLISEALKNDIFIWDNSKLVHFDDNVVLMIKYLLKKNFKQVICNETLFLVSPQITQLPDNMTVKGSLYITSKNIKELPKNLTVTKFLNVSKTMIPSLPEDANVGTFVESLYVAAQERRINNDWRTPNVADEDGKKAIALHEFLLDENIIDSDQDVYDMIPEDKQYEMVKFFIMGQEEKEYLVGTEEEIETSARESLKDTIDDIGLKDFGAKWLITNNLDEDSLKSHIEDIVSEGIRDYPEEYDIRVLPSSEELERIELLNNEIEKLKLRLKKFKTITSKSYKDISTKINELYEEIENIEENPSGEYDEDEINNLIESRVEDAIVTYGLDIEDFVNIEGVIDDVIQHDGYSTLSSYDGEIHEVSVGAETYYIIKYN